MERSDAVVEAYECLDELEHDVGGRRLLKETSGQMRWPDRGVYFFFELGEGRCGS